MVHRRLGLLEPHAPGHELRLVKTGSKEPRLLGEWLLNPPWRLGDEADCHVGKLASTFPIRNMNQGGLVNWKAGRWCSSWHVANDVREPRRHDGEVPRRRVFKAPERPRAPIGWRALAAWFQGRRVAKAPSREPRMVGFRGRGGTERGRGENPRRRAASSDGATLKYPQNNPSGSLT